MTVDQVTVLSTDGTILASGGDSASATPAKMISLEKTIGRELRDNIAKTLTPYLGFNNFEISVAARLNTDKRQTNETSYNPESRVERSVRVVKETGNQQNSNSRTPVSVEQNVPAEQTATSPAGDQSRRSNERREELTNYEVSSKVVNTVSEGYKIEQLTVAVVVNRKRLLAALGEGAGPEAVDKQLKEVERLIESAAGVDAKRGDRITVAAVDFTGGQALEPVASPGIVEQLFSHLSSVINAAAILGVSALLIMFGLRPATRVLLENRSSEPEAAAKLQADTPLTEVPAVAGGEQPNLIADLTEKLGRTPLKRLEQMIDYDEDQAAAILRQWMRGAERA
jgi:flagellar M-ring protein FliF